MANNFSRSTARNIGTTLTPIGSVVPAATQVTVIGLSIANTTNGVVKAAVVHSDGSNTTYIVKNMDIVPGQAQVLVGGDQKLVLLPGDTISVVSDTASSLDVIMSTLVITTV